MTRDKALQAFDRLVELGYSVSLHGNHMGGYVGHDVDENGCRYTVNIVDLSVDKVDIRALVAVADELELDVGYNPMRGGGGISFGVPMKARHPSISGPRKHPLATQRDNDAA